MIILASNPPPHLPPPPVITMSVGLSQQLLRWESAHEVADHEAVISF